MKTVRLFATLFVVAVCAMVVSSCGDDDNLKNGTSGKKVTQMRVTKEGYEGEIYTLQYSNNSLVNWIFDEGGDYCNVQCVSKTDKMIKFQGSLDMSTNTTVTFMLNNNGLATSMLIEDLDSPGNDFLINFEYSNGYLTSMTTEYATYTFKYGNGNLIECKHKDSEGSETTYSYTYTNIPNKANMFDFYFIEDIGGWLECWQFLGVMGTPSKNLVKQCTAIGRYENGGEYTYTETFTHTLDNEGYVTMTRKDDDDGYYYYTVEYFYE